MKLSTPFEIAPNLQAGIRIGKDWITIEYSARSGRDNRTRYKYTLLIGDREYTSDDLQSGSGGGSLQEGMESLLSFLGAAGDAYRWCMREGNESDNADLFPAWINEWCYQNSDEISMMQCEIEESRELIEE